MAAVDDCFLADLEELSDTEEAAIQSDDTKTANFDPKSVLQLQEIQRYIDDVMRKIYDAESLEDQLIRDCTTLLVDIENYLVIIHNFIRDNYRTKFPELEAVVQHPIDYARAIKKIGNEMDLTSVDFEGLLPLATIMVVSIMGSSTSGKPLSEGNFKDTIDACDRVIALDLAKRTVLDFIESRMVYVAPNLSAIVGSAVAAKLLGIAGGLSALANMPACNVQLLGAKEKNLLGYSSATISQFRAGYIVETAVFQSTPPSLRARACRLLAAKSTLAARVDCARGDSTGTAGRMMLEEMWKTIAKWQQRPPAKILQPLPVPDSRPKKKRGGRRLRKTNEKYGMTMMRKLANRVQFGIVEESSGGFGMLGQAGSDRLRILVARSKVAKKLKMKNMVTLSKLMVLT